MLRRKASFLLSILAFHFRPRRRRISSQRPKIALSFHSAVSPLLILAAGSLGCRASSCLSSSLPRCVPSATLSFRSLSAELAAADLHVQSASPARAWGRPLHCAGCYNSAAKPLARSLHRSRASPSSCPAPLPPRLRHRFHALTRRHTRQGHLAASSLTQLHSPDLDDHHHHHPGAFITIRPSFQQHPASRPA